MANTGQTTTNAGIAGVALAGLALAAMRRRKNK
ncbi:LPXTG cell wall anchor domain-containing protein [Gemella morbillorum]